MKRISHTLFLIFAATLALWSQEEKSNYTKSVLEKVSVQTLFSYYTQEGNNAAVTGGEGTEALTNAAPTMVVQIPIGADGILTVDTGLSAYTSASSSNVNPFDGKSADASPWVASSGPSSSDVLAHFNSSY